MYKYQKDIVEAVVFLAFVLVAISIAYYLMLMFALAFVFIFEYAGMTMSSLTVVSLTISMFGIFMALYYGFLKIYYNIYTTIVKEVKRAKKRKDILRRYRPYEFKLKPATCLSCGDKVFMVSLNPISQGLCRDCILKEEDKKYA